MQTKFIPYAEFEAFAAYPSEEKRPLVILCHAWRGRDDFICEKAKQVAELGFVGFALDLYGKGVLGRTKEENAALKKPLLDDRTLLQKRLRLGYETARALPFVDPTKVAILGFGFGGLCALDLARTCADLKGAVSIYGHFDPLPGYPTLMINAKVLLLHGYNDPISPMREMQAFMHELDEAKIDWQSHIFGNTFHSFMSPASNDPGSGILYHPLSAKRAWEETEKFLQEVLAD